MKHGLITLMWDDSVGEGSLRYREAFDHAGLVTKLDFLTDVISELETLKDTLLDDLMKHESKYRF